jgi:hypothetical protein
LERLIAEAEEKRESKWKRDFSSIEHHLKSIEPYRKRFIERLGGFPGSKTPLNPHRELRLHCAASARRQPGAASWCSLPTS